MRSSLPSAYHQLSPQRCALEPSDAGTISPPFNFAVRDAGFRELVSFLKEEFVELQGSILMHERLLQSDPALVEKFVRGTLKGLRYARENKAGTIPILLRYMKIKEDLAGQYYDQVRPIMTSGRHRQA